MDFQYPKPELLKSAASALSSLSNTVIVVKVGGEILEDEARAKALACDLIELRLKGVQIALCHGGGPQISKELKRQGIEPVFSGGQRVTDKKTLDVLCKILLGDINRTLVSLFSSFAGIAVGLSGVDGRIFLAKERDPKLGFVGNVKSVNSELVSSIMQSGYIPVIASLGVDESGQCFNINADIAAGELAGALKAKRFFVLTNVEGLYRSFEDKSSLISKTTLHELKSLLSSGTLSEGMIPKIESVVHAMEKGVPEVQILDGRVQHVIIDSFSKSQGTFVTR